jgi:hypothetical protein
VPRPVGVKNAAETASLNASASRDNAEAMGIGFSMVENALMAAAHVASIYVLYRFWRAFHFVENVPMKPEEWWTRALGIVSPVLGMLKGIIENGGDVQKGVAQALGAFHQAIMSMVLAALSPFIKRVAQPDGSVINTIEPHNAAILAFMTYGVGVMALKSGLVGQAVNGGLQMIGGLVPG